MALSTVSVDAILARSEVRIREGRLATCHTVLALLDLACEAEAGTDDELADAILVRAEEEIARASLPLYDEPLLEDELPPALARGQIVERLERGYRWVRCAP